MACDRFLSPTAGRSSRGPFSFMRRMPMTSSDMAQCAHCQNSRWSIVGGKNVCSACGQPYEPSPVPGLTKPAGSRALLAPVGAQSTALFSYERPANESNQRRGARALRGPVWALGVMPPVMIAVGWLIQIAILKSSARHTVLVVPALGVIGFGCFILGIVIVYIGTNDFVLTIGFIVVGWIESYFVGLVLSAALMGSLGASLGLFGAGVHHPPSSAKPVAAAGTFPTVRSPRHGHSAAGSPVLRRAVNRQGFILNVDTVTSGQDLEVDAPLLGPPAFRVDGRLLPVAGSSVALNCYRANGTGVALKQAWPAADSFVDWHSSNGQLAGLTRCAGSITVPADGRRYRLDSWTQGRQ